jgi:hypothetical protein
MKKKVIMFQGQGFTDNSTPPDPPTGSGSFVTTEELTRWQNRWESKMYWTFNKHGVNDPGNASSIVEQKDWFMVNNMLPFRAPDSNNKQNYSVFGYWGHSGYPRTLPVPSWANDVQHFYHNKHGHPKRMSVLICSAFYGLVTGDNSVINKVKDKILEQVREHQADFTNTSIWLPGGTTQLPGGSNTAQHHRGQTNPFFFIGDWAAQVLKSASFHKDKFTTSEWNEIKSWALGVGNFIKDNIDDYFVNVWDDRENYVIKPSKSTLTGTTHDGGYGFCSAQTDYNNRTCSSQILGLTICGCIAENTALKDYAKQIFRELMAIAVYPDGTTSEFHRSGESGLNYWCTMVNQISEAAQALYTHDGDDYFWTTTVEGGTTAAQVGSGVTPTESPGDGKGLYKYLEMMSKYFKSTDGVDRYRNGLIDGDEGGGGRRINQFALVSAARCWRHYGDSWMLDFLKMDTGAGYRRGWQPESIVKYLGHAHFDTYTYGAEPSGALMYFHDQ